MDASDPRVQTLMDDLAGAVNLTAAGASWREETIDFMTLGSDTRSTAIALAAFTQIRPDDPILPNVVRWLMSARTAGIWATTQENAWSIIALTDYMVQTGELEADYAWQTTLNDGRTGQRDVRQHEHPRIDDAAHRDHRAAARRGKSAAHQPRQRQRPALLHDLSALQPRRAGGGTAGSRHRRRPALRPRRRDGEAARLSATSSASPSRLWRRPTSTT
jgi:hypothetical protein